MRAADEDFARAERHIVAARYLAQGGFADIAAREAYMAAFHAAHGYLATVSGRAPRTHRGLIGSFGQLARDDPAIPPDLLRVLPRGFEDKSLADYGGPADADSAAAIAAATRMLDAARASAARFTRLAPDELGPVFAACWSARTSSQWLAENPARGQCNVTALVAEEVLGGELLRTITPGGWHYYNRVEGVRVDFTAGQFAGPIRYSDTEALRREALADTTVEQYQAFRDAFVRRVVHG